MKKTFLIVLLFFAVAAMAVAQERTITGTVTSEADGLSLPGVSVSVKGTSIGAVTNVDGKYNIKVKSGNDILVFSFIGMQTKEVKVGTSKVVDVKLKDDAMGLDEVVVTAMGIKREKKSINYAIQEVKGEELIASKETNLVNALSGKAAGVNIIRSSGDVGSSSQIIIRGGQSLGGNNQPLFVVDGIPIDNTAMNGSSLEGIGSSRQMDEINRAADIDPEDVKSISILKGPAAAALYGIDAAGGAIIITTKTGEKGEGKISYSNNFRWSMITDFPEEQTKYGLGYKGHYYGTSFWNSWGPRISETPDHNKVYDNMDAFFKTGFTARHHINFSEASEKGSFRLSASTSNQSGIVPESEYKNSSIRYNFRREIKKWITLSGGANYIRSESDKSAKGANGFYVRLLDYPRNYDITDWENPDGSQKIIDPANKRDNPLYAVNNNTVNTTTDHFIINTTALVKPFKDFTWTTIGGLDFYETKGQSVWKPGTTLSGLEKGALSEYTLSTHVYNLNSRLAYVYRPVKDITLDFMAGVSIYDYDRVIDSRYGNEFLEPDFVGIKNFESDKTSLSTSIREKRRVGLYGEVKFEYKKLFYISATGREDYSSTLPSDNRSFFYPSVSGGLIVSEILPEEYKEYISYFKIRSIWSKVGKDPSPYITGTSLSLNTMSSSGFYNGYTVGNPNLKPETTTTKEFGFDLKLLKGRLSFDFTYYDMYSDDMIISPRTSYASGGGIFTSINDGAISNKGIELMVNVRPLDMEDLKWDITANYSKNNGKLEEFPDNLDYYYDSETWVYKNIRVGAYRGEAYSGLIGLDYERTDDGKIVCDEKGYPIRNTKEQKIGDREPDFQIGLTNTLRYKGFQLSFLLDIRRGGDVYNGTAAMMHDRGKHPNTVNRGKQIIIDGVVQDKYKDGDAIPDGKSVGDDIEGQYSPNSTPIEMDRNFFENYYANVESNFVENVNWVRLRNISLSYKVPISILKKSPFTKAEINFTGNNLALWTNYTGVDPEINTLGAGRAGLGGGGIDFGTVPSTRSYSLGIKLTF